MSNSVRLPAFSCLFMVFLSACTMGKLEARLEANPQCKEVINPKTGAQMPCPGSDRAFYVAAGLEEPRKAKVSAVPAISNDMGATNNSASQVVSSLATPSNSSSTPKTQIDCKAKLHQKTGGLLPCPPLD
jgi:hypothetical protein